MLPGDPTTITNSIFSKLVFHASSLCNTLERKELCIKCFDAVLSKARKSLSENDFYLFTRYKQSCPLEAIRSQTRKKSHQKSSNITISQSILAPHLQKKNWAGKNHPKLSDIIRCFVKHNVQCDTSENYKKDIEKVLHFFPVKQLLYNTSYADMSFY